MRLSRHSTPLLVVLLLAFPSAAAAYPPAIFSDITQDSARIGGLDCGTRYQIREFRSGQFRDPQEFTTAACPTVPPPTASFTISPSPAETGQAAQLDWTGTCAAAPCSLSWENEGTDGPGGTDWPIGSADPQSYTSNLVGTKVIHLVVTDVQGRTAELRKDHIVQAPAPPNPACSNGADDDSDGATDWPNDLGCTDANDTDESNALPGTCASSGLHAPDSPDGFGGCWPGPSNTGVPAGTNLATYSGPCNITVPNTVIDSKTVNCNLVINATGVQIKNSVVNGTINGNGYTVTDTTIDAGEVNATFNNGPRALEGQNWTAVRVEAFRGISGGWCKNCRLEDSWIHGQDPDEGGRAHQSGVRMDQNSIIRHNTLRCDAPTVPPDAGCSGDLTGYGDFDPVRDNLIERNLFMTTTGGTCAYGGSSGGKPYSNAAANIRFIDNVFDRRADSVQPSGKCGHWFAITDFDVNAPGNVWQNNRYHDGALVAPE